MNRFINLPMDTYFQVLETGLFIHSWIYTVRTSSCIPTNDYDCYVSELRFSTGVKYVDCMEDYSRNHLDPFGGLISIYDIKTTSGDI